VLDGSVTTKYILAGVAIIFVVATAVRLTQSRRLDPQSRTWLLISIIFGLVSAWLWVAT
jgi:hypothetical protein